MTSETLTAEQAKAKHIHAMGEDLGAVYDALWQQVAWLHRKWSEYVVLFGTKESRVTLLNNAAPSFSRILQDSLWEDVLLNIARLTDPPRSAGKFNLSVQALVELVGHAETKALVKAGVAEALAASEFCRDWRNRHIAHRDLRLALQQGAEALKPACLLKVSDALRALEAVLNAVSNHYIESTTFFDFDPGYGGAISLLHVLDSGLEAQRMRHERLINDPIDHRPRDL